MAHWNAEAERIRRLGKENGLDDPEALRGMIAAEPDAKLRASLERRLVRVEADTAARAERKAATDAMGPGELAELMWVESGRVL